MSASKSVSKNTVRFNTLMSDDETHKQLVSRLEPGVASGSCQKNSKKCQKHLLYISQIFHIYSHESLRESNGEKGETRDFDCFFAVWPL